MKKLSSDKKHFWSSIGLTCGLAFYFFGVMAISPTVPLIVGWLCFGTGIVMFILGFAIAPK